MTEPADVELPPHRAPSWYGHYSWLDAMVRWAAGLLRSATSANTAGAIVKRDANSLVEVNRVLINTQTPAAGRDGVRRDWVEAQIAASEEAQRAAFVSPARPFLSHSRLFRRPGQVDLGFPPVGERLTEPATLVQQLGAETFVYAFCDLNGGRVLAATYPNGAVYRTLDYGRTWALVLNNAGGAATLHDLYHVGDGVVLGATDNASKIARSTDYGATWTTSATSPQLNASILKANCLTQLDNGTVLAGTYNNSAGGGMVFRSTDEGATWDAGRSLGDAKGVNIFVDFGDGIVVAGSQNSTPGSVEWFRSTDGGVTWTRLTTDSGLGLTSGEYGHAGALIGDGTAVIGTYGGSGQTSIYRTTDYGETWTRVATPAVTGIFSLRNLGNGVVLAGSGITTTKAKSFISRDYGRSFTELQAWADTTTHILDVCHLGGGVLLYGTGTTGQVWRT